VRDFAVRQFERTQGVAQQRAFFDLLYMHRNSPLMRPFYDWEAMRDTYAEGSDARDYGTILQAVRRYESEEAARIAAFWIEAQPAAARAFRGGRGELFGFGINLVLPEPTAEQRSMDPAMDRAGHFLERHAPLRDGEVLLYQRFGGGLDGYQLNMGAQNMMAMEAFRLWASVPRLAWSFVCLTVADHFAPMFAYLRFQRLPELDFEVGGTRYGVFAHDWRVEPLTAWLDGMSERELAMEQASELPPAAPAPLVLSQPEFRQSVRDALRDYHDPAALSANPLLRSRLCAEGAHPP
jgi:hypothetical protein